MEKFEEAHEGGISLREAIEGITVAARIWHRLGWQLLLEGEEVSRMGKKELLILLSCFLDILAYQIVAEVFHNNVAVSTLDTLVIDTNNHGGIGLFDGASRSTLSASQALSWNSADRDKLLVADLNACCGYRALVEESKEKLSA